MSDLSTTEVPRTTQLREIWSKPRFRNILITSIVSPFLPRVMKTSPFKTSGEAPPQFNVRKMDDMSYCRAGHRIPTFKNSAHNNIIYRPKNAIYREK